MALEEKKSSSLGLADESGPGETSAELDVINILGYKPELRRNRSMFTLLFQSLAIAAVCFFSTYFSVSLTDLHGKKRIAKLR